MKRVCIVSTVAVTPRSFMLPHFKVLSKEFEITLISNFENCEMSVFLYPGVGVSNCFHIPFSRKISPVIDLKTCMELYLLLKREKFDYILSMTPKAGLLTALAGYKCGAKEVIHLFTGQVWANKKGLYRRMLMGMDKLVGLLNTRILVDGLAQLNYLKEQKIIPASSSILASKNSMASVNCNKFKPNILVRHSIRSQYNLTTETVLFFLGRMNKDKGILDLIDAFVLMHQEYSSAVLYLAGKDEENIIELVKNKYDSLLLQKITFLGNVDNPYDYIQMCDIFIMPSHREGFGCSVIEASACEKPVICSDIWGLSDAFIDNVTGLKFEVGNVTSLCNALKTLLDNKDQTLSYGVNGRKYVLDHFEESKISDAWLQYFLRI